MEEDPDCLRKKITFTEIEKESAFSANKFPYPYMPTSEEKSSAELKAGLDLEPGHAHIMAGLLNPRLDEKLLRENFTRAQKKVVFAKDLI